MSAARTSRSASSIWFWRDVEIRQIETHGRGVGKERNRLTVAVDRAGHVVLAVGNPRLKKQVVRAADVFGGWPGRRRDLQPQHGADDQFDPHGI